MKTGAENTHSKEKEADRDSTVLFFFFYKKPIMLNEYFLREVQKKIGIAFMMERDYNIQALGR